MGLLLALASMAIAASALSGAAKDMNASSADRRVRNNGYNLYRDFEDVLRVCYVSRKKQDGIKYLPEGEWKRCISYIRRQPHTTDKDVENFINHYEIVRQRELNKINKHWKDEYDKAHKEYLSNPMSNRELVFEKEFYAFFDEEFVRDLADELYEKTFMGDMAVQRPKVVPIEASNEAYVMVWVLHCYGGKSKVKEYFRACCRYLNKPID